MDRIIVLTATNPLSREQRDHLVAGAKAQLPSEGFVVLFLPVGVKAYEIGIEPTETVTIRAEVSKPTTESPSGREVQHMDVPDDDQPIRFLWLTKDECTEEQRAMAVGEHGGRWAVGVENCTPEQLAGCTISEL